MTESFNYAEISWLFQKFTKFPYMEWIFREKKFGTRIYGPWTNISAGVRIKILPDFKFPQIYMHYISLDCKFSIKSIFLCIQHAKSSIKTISSKIFEQNVDYTKVDQFSTRDFRNNNVSRKIITPSDFF